MSDVTNEITRSQGLHGQTSPTDSEQGEPQTPQLTRIVCTDPQDPDVPCPVCQGMGVIKYDVEPGDPRFGKLFRCPNFPLEVDQERQERLRRLSNLHAFADKSFENFEINIRMYLEREQASLMAAHRTCSFYAEDPEGWLVLEGKYGTGKTHLAAAIGNARLQMGESVLFLTVPDLLDHLRGGYAPGAEITYDETFERILSTPLLILDDLGVENPSEWAKEKLFQILNHRYSHKKPTVITTNINVDDLDARIRSRLMDKDIISRVVIQAPDYRDTTPNQHGQLLSRIEMYRHMTFDSFVLDRYLDQNEQRVLTKCVEAAYEFAHRPSGWLLLTGGYGSGKTHLAAAIANTRRIEYGDEVVFLTVPDLLDYLRATYNDNSPLSLDKLLGKLRDVQILVLDDLGTESSSAWAQEKLFQLFDYRYVAQLPTVITMWNKLDDPKLNKRVVSRLVDQRICHNLWLDVDSYAQRMKRR